MLAENDKRPPISDFLEPQGRFGKLDDDALTRIQERVNQRWQKAVERHKADE